MHRDLLKRFLTLVLFATMLVALTACGEEDSAPASANPTSTTEQPTMTASTRSVETPAETQVSAGPTATEPQPAGREPTTAPESTSTPESVIVDETAVPTDEPETVDEPLPEPENPAPELAAIDEWYNSAPLSLAQLRGNPVLLVFWATY